ncbi:MAG: TIGR03435 family protein [Verrucomicrobiales bacterium]|nr:TIGR03435 family protein [Verrucomicrobiales bacterium]
MTEPDDHQLLAEFARENSEAAFAALVSRHVNLVYSVAFRHTGNAHAAEEITQAVFIILARKAKSITGKIILSGWLYQTTRLTAANFLRGEIRRQRREQETYMQSTLNEPDVWPQIAPLLDDALARLGGRDRDAIVLRFFENKSLNEVGAALGASEDAAKMRVNRALEKLRKIFTKHGVTLTATVIAGAVTANSVQAAPVGLAVTVTAAAAKGAVVGSSTLTLIKGALKIMAWTKAKTAIVVGAGVLLAAGTTTIAVKEIQEHKTYSWQVPRASFDVLYKTPPQVVIVPTKFSEDGGGVGSNDRVLGIAQPVKEIIQAAYRKSKSRTVIVAELPEGKYDYIANLPDGRGSGKALQEEIKRVFHITGRLEQRETDVLVLKAANSHVDGFKTANSLRRSMQQPKSAAIMSGLGLFVGFDQPISTLAPFLESRFKIPIIDQTGLSKHYDFNLTWDEKDRDHLNSAGLQQALLNQLGLELVPSREPVEMLVVEKVKD